MEILAALSRSRWAKHSLLCGFVLTLAACGKSEGDGGHAGGPPPVSVAPVVQRDVQEFDEFTARLEAPDTVDIRSRVAGMLTKVHFREGQIVKKGDRLF